MKTVMVAGGEINLLAKRLADKEVLCKRQFELALERMEQEVGSLREQFTAGLVPVPPVDLVSQAGKAYGTLMVWQNTREHRKALPENG